ncbi:MAG: hypothetical protein LRZ85_08240 [Alphaproteobacteria bacterium]|nr:hypothetical protein [Alphaproteobacteria bacterium]
MENNQDLECYYLISNWSLVVDEDNEDDENTTEMYNVASGISLQSFAAIVKDIETRYELAYHAEADAGATIILRGPVSRIEDVERELGDRFTLLPMEEEGMLAYLKEDTAGDPDFADDDYDPEDDFEEGQDLSHADYIRTLDA